MIRRIAHLLELSYIAMLQEKYARASDLYNQIVLIDPNYLAARDLSNLAARLRHGRFADGAIQEILSGYERETNDDSEDLRIPFRDTLRIPDPEAWSVLSEVLSPEWTMGGGSDPNEPDLAAIRWKLETGKYDVNFENVKVEDILAFIRDASGLNILLDAVVRDRIDPDELMTVRCTGMLLKDLLAFLVEPRGLVPVVTEERVVLLTAPERAAGFAAQK